MRYSVKNGSYLHSPESFGLMEVKFVVFRFFILLSLALLKNGGSYPVTFRFWSGDLGPLKVWPFSDGNPGYAPAANRRA